MLSVIIATAKRNSIISKRVFPWSFIIGRLLMGFYIPAFSYFTYHYMFKGRLASSFGSFVGSQDYLTYVTLGAALYTLAVAVLMNVGRSLMNELREGTLESLFLTPASRLGYFIGNMIEQVWRSSLEFLVILIVGWMLGAKVYEANIVNLIIVLTIAIFGFFCMGIALSSFMLFFKDTYISQNTLFIAMSFLCGISFPIHYLPLWLQKISLMLPLTHSVELFRDVVLMNQSLYSEEFIILKLLFIDLLYGIGGVWWLKKMEKRLMESI